MAKEVITIDGDVVENLPNATFKVTINDEKFPQMNMTIIAHMSWKIRMNNIKIIPWDKVQIDMSPYDLTKWRITFRYRPNK